MIGALTASCGNNCPGLSGLPAPAALERSVREGGVGEQASRKTRCALQGSCSPRAALPALSPPGFYIRESWL
ncbi:hypothetical protein AAFF_G00013760 [Aldrovandia affinis]|uniref:Uncharacterized protein n=1 Tax=Aldrovandia affinis TaxID=143900 RepID=A0AAD7WH42_9TELE|nr:hypothetical protein AAFF_G00013760 [Aldrovandia affinis]